MTLIIKIWRLFYGYQKKMRYGNGCFIASCCSNVLCTSIFTNTHIAPKSRKWPHQSSFHVSTQFLNHLQNHLYISFAWRESAFLIWWCGKFVEWLAGFKQFKTFHILMRNIFFFWILGQTLLQNKPHDSSYLLQKLLKTLQLKCNETNHKPQNLHCHTNINVQRSRNNIQCCAWNFKCVVTQNEIMDDILLLINSLTWTWRMKRHQSKKLFEQKQLISIFWNACSMLLWLSIFWNVECEKQYLNHILYFWQTIPYNSSSTVMVLYGL